MLKRTLEAVGLRTTTDIPAAEIFSPALDYGKYGLRSSDAERLHLLRDFVMEYSRELPPDPDVKVCNSGKAASLMKDVFRGMDHEEVWIILLNSDNRLLNRMLVCIGGIASSIIACRRIAKSALENNAAGVLLYHNHPSGNVSPSAHDVRETERLRDCLKVFDIALTDHIILSDTCYVRSSRIFLAYSFGDSPYLSLNL